jgi:3-oxoacyl-[acyl-carrier-protein] synthase II
MRRTVCIIGFGALSPLGVGLPDHLAALRTSNPAAARSGAPAHAFLPHFGRVPPFDPVAYIPQRKTLKLMNRQTLLGCASAAAALRDADAGSTDGADGVVFGSGVWNGSVVSMRDALMPSLRSDGTVDYDYLCAEGYRNLPPHWILPLLPNTTAGQISILNRLKGLNLSIVNGPSSGFVALGEAFAAVRAGRASRLVCGGAEGDPPADLFSNLEQRGFASRSGQRRLLL